MRVLTCDPDSHVGVVLAGSAFAPPPPFAVVPARRAGEALLQIEDDASFDAAFIDVRVALEGEARLMQELRRRAPALPLLVVASSISTAQAREVVQQGARGIVLLSMSREAILRSVDIAASGGFFLPPGVFDAAEVLAPRCATAPLANGLTPRQREVLKLLAEGRATREISRSLGMSEGTVKNHLSAIFRLLHVKNRVQAVLRAQQL